MALLTTEGKEDARVGGAGAPPVDRRPRRSTGRRPAAARIFNGAVSANAEFEPSERSALYPWHKADGAPGSGGYSGLPEAG